VKNKTENILQENRTITSGFQGKKSLLKRKTRTKGTNSKENSDTF
jgi:hypothetical protein